MEEGRGPSASGRMGTRGDDFVSEVSAVIEMESKRIPDHIMEELAENLSEVGIAYGPGFAIHYVVLYMEGEPDGYVVRVWTSLTGSWEVH